MKKHIIYATLIMLMSLFLITGPVYAESGSSRPDMFDDAREELMTEKEVIAWLEANMPESLEMMKKLRTESPGEYDEVFEDEIEMLVDTIIYLEEVRREDPKLFQRLLEAEKLEYKTWGLAEEYRKTTAKDKKEQIRTEMKEALNRIFELRLKEKEMEIQDLEKELKSLKEMLTRRRDFKDRIIDNRMRELLDYSDEALAWW